MIRTPNRGVAIAGAALGSVGLAVGVLGLATAQAASSSIPAPRTVAVAPNHDSEATLQRRAAASAKGSAQDSAKDSDEAVTTERRTTSAEAAAVAAAAKVTRTVRPEPEPKHKKPKKASRSVVRQPLTPREMAQALVADRGWNGDEFTCLDKLWTRESGWNVHEQNGGSGAYGIPQSLPGRKMASFGGDWRDNPMTQIRWGLSYIAGRYSTPCAAWEHSLRYNYY